MNTKNLMKAIFILDSDPSDGTLELSDNGVSRVTKNEVVNWIVHPNSGVDSITAIPPKSGSVDVFIKGDPHPLGSSKNWQGRIQDLKVYTEEDYNIVWKDNSGKVHTYDPKLKVNI